MALFPDAHCHEVRDAIDEVLSTHGDRLHDAGLLSNAAAPEADDPTIRWGGFRLVRRGPRVGAPSRRPSARGGLFARAARRVAGPRD